MQHPGKIFQDIPNVTICLAFLDLIHKYSMADKFAVDSDCIHEFLFREDQ